VFTTRPRRIRPHPSNSICLARNILPSSVIVEMVARKVGEHRTSNGIPKRAVVPAHAMTLPSPPRSLPAQSSPVAGSVPALPALCAEPKNLPRHVISMFQPAPFRPAALNIDSIKNAVVLFPFVPVIRYWQSAPRMPVKICAQPRQRPPPCVTCAQQPPDAAFPSRVRDHAPLQRQSLDR